MVPTTPACTWWNRPEVPTTPACTWWNRPKVPTTPACTWWNRPEEDNSSGKLESTHPSRTSVKSDQVFFGVESVMRVNADSLLIRAAATSTSGTLNDLTTDLIMANNNNNNYCLIVSGFDSSRILLLQKRAMRTITNSWYRAYATLIFRSLNVLKINYLYWLMALKFYYIIENKLLPFYFDEFIPLKFAGS